MATAIFTPENQLSVTTTDSVIDLDSPAFRGGYDWTDSIDTELRIAGFRRTDFWQIRLTSAAPGRPDLSAHVFVKVSEVNRVAWTLAADQEWVNRSENRNVKWTVVLVAPVEPVKD